MKVLVIGAGPAGLGFAVKAAELGLDVVVADKRGADETPGWGVTLRDRAFETVGLGDLKGGAKLQGRRMYYAGNQVIDLPNPAAGHLVTMARATFLQALRRRCRDLGVRMVWNVDANELPQDVLDRADLVVAADGVHSTLRGRYAEAFAPRITQGANRFAWLGTSADLDKLTIMVRDEGLPIVAWGYRYAPGRSTLIVEATERIYQQELARRPDAWVASRLRATLSEELDGANVLHDGEVRWQRFPVLSCARLVHENLVLIGDSAHTTHYSQGFGTLFALDDALALAGALAHHDLPGALEAYEAEQAPKVERYQEICAGSMRWSEDLAAAAERRDAAGIHALMQARWPDNAVNEAPLDRAGSAA